MAAVGRELSSGRAETETQVSGPCSFCAFCPAHPPSSVQTGRPEVWGVRVWLEARRSSAAESPGGGRSDVERMEVHTQ